MGRNSGGVNSNGIGSSSYDRATDALLTAFGSNNKSGISKATKRIESAISKMSDDVVKTRSLAFSDAAYYTSRKMNPRSEYDPATHNYSKKMSQLYQKEMKKRKLK